MLDVLKLEATAQHVLVTTLQELPAENQAHVLGRVVDQLLGAKITFYRRIGPPENPRAPRGVSIDETVALAMTLGRIRNEDISSFRAMSPKGADRRIRDAKELGRIERVSQGVYEASEEEYERIGIDPTKKGYPLPIKCHEIVARMQRRVREMRGEADHSTNESQSASPRRQST